MAWIKKSVSVNTVDLDQRLVHVLGILGSIHTALFGKDLVVTSANDGVHSRGSKHYRNLAVDLRSIDKGSDQQALFGILLQYLSPLYNLAVFDERQRDAGPHWHVEIAD